MGLSAPSMMATRTASAAMVAMVLAISKRPSPALALVVVCPDQALLLALVVLVVRCMNQAVCGEACTSGTVVHLFCPILPVMLTT